ncbi:MAG: 2-amino-4-hydroxy-6-hydroxymethyldihydropteridine diphosphokinase [Motiliproteus sp.]|jgi:2-amino-4-hydroxy-6-hydroxymethyldihydropteridine diphosphokinase
MADSLTDPAIDLSASPGSNLEDSLLSQLLPQAIDLYIGLGSNLEDPLQQVRQALIELGQLPCSALIRHSRLYRSDPVGPAGQPDYINAVAHLRTRLQPERMLDQLQTLERQHHRVRRQHWGARTLDLDILVFGDQQIHTARLSVPHPYMAERSFVLYPLQEIAPELRLPNGDSLTQLMAHCERGTLTPVQV